MISMMLFLSIWLREENFLNENSLPAAAAAAKSLQSCPTLCDPIDGSPPGSPVPGILQARTLEWITISFSNAWKWKVKSESEFAQSCPTLHDPMDYSPPGSSVHGIFQARVLEWGAIAFSGGFPYFLQFRPSFYNKELMIWAIFSSLSCFCWLYRASPSSAAKNIINLNSVWPSGYVHV